MGEEGGSGWESQIGTTAIVERMANSEKELTTCMLNLEDELNSVECGVW